MWPDNETETDFLNFSGVADTVAEIIVQSRGRPISIGVSGAWGVGKSSMIRLIRNALKERAVNNAETFVFVEFNAWLYQGYDDARAALLEVIATALSKEAESRKTGLDKVENLIKRVNWLRAVKLTTGPALALMLGLPPIGFRTTELVGEVGNITNDLTKPDDPTSPPKEIHAIRECFEQTLAEIGIKIVVLIDDLDRCLPPTTISTLEAIRLFLFLKNTAFVIAADDVMIKHAVKNHFGDVDDTHVTNYFDKLVQVPIRVPPLGTQEVRSYMMLLFVENSELSNSDKEMIRVKVCEQLAQTWRGKRVDRAFVQKVCSALPPELIAQFDTADRLAPLMTTTSQIAGNPRIIKRFLNALSVRMTISNAHGVGVDEAVLAKMLLFERCATPAIYDELTRAINNDDEGKPRFLVNWEKQALAGKKIDLSELWNNPFVEEWLTVPPRLGDIDLRGVLYVSREHAPLITPKDRLSSEGAELLAAILEHPSVSAELHERLTHLPQPETAIIMDRLLERARQIQEWGTPDILEACLTVVSVDSTQEARLAAFLCERPVLQIKPAIVPRISDQHWAKEVFNTWCASDISQPVKNAIVQEQKKHGHL